MVLCIMGLFFSKAVDNGIPVLASAAGGVTSEWRGLRGALVPGCGASAVSDTRAESDSGVRRKSTEHGARSTGAALWQKKQPKPVDVDLFPGRSKKFMRYRGSAGLPGAAARETIQSHAVSAAATQGTYRPFTMQTPELPPTARSLEQPRKQTWPPSHIFIHPHKTRNKVNSAACIAYSDPIHLQLFPFPAKVYYQSIHPHFDKIDSSIHRFIDHRFQLDLPTKGFKQNP